MTTVVIAEDHHLVRQGFSSLLEKQTDLTVVGETGSGREAVDMVMEFEPDVLVLDLTLPELHGLEVARQVNYQVPSTKVVILSMHDRKAYVVSAFRNGAVGYVLKDDHGEHLIDAISAAVEGGHFLSPCLDFSFEDVQEEIETSKELSSANVLTPREKEVLRYIGAGHTTPEIANELSISTRTVDVHRTNIMGKLELENVNQVVRWAIEHGFLPRRDGR